MTATGCVGESMREAVKGEGTEGGPTEGLVAREGQVFIRRLPVLLMDIHTDARLYNSPKLDGFLVLRLVVPNLLNDLHTSI